MGGAIVSQILLLGSSCLVFSCLLLPTKSFDESLGMYYFSFFNLKVLIYLSNIKASYYYCYPELPSKGKKKKKKTCPVYIAGRYLPINRAIYSTIHICRVHI